MNHPLSRTALLCVATAFALALVGGYLTHRANPYGLYLYTPTDWCLGKRAHGFALGYLAVLWSAAAVSLMAAAGLALYRRSVERTGGSGQTSSAASGALRTGLLLLTLSGLAGGGGLFLPLAVEPRCQGHTNTFAV